MTPDQQTAALATTELKRAITTLANPHAELRRNIDLAETLTHTALLILRTHATTDWQRNEIARDIANRRSAQGAKHDQDSRDPS